MFTIGPLPELRSFIGRILLVLDKHGVCKHTRKRAHQLGIDLIFIPSGSPHLNPIENVWDYLKWTMAPIIVENEDEFKMAGSNSDVCCDILSTLVSNPG